MVRMCDLKAECRSSLPVAVTLKRFATALEDLPLRLAALAFFMTELIAGEDASDGAPAAGTSTRTGATPVGTKADAPANRQAKRRLLGNISRAEKKNFLSAGGAS